MNSEEIPGVTISNDKLAKAKEKETATDLARALFRAVFTSNALLSCSLGGQRATGVGSRSVPRPALEPAAVQSIFGECYFFFTLGLIMPFIPTWFNVVLP